MNNTMVWFTWAMQMQKQTHAQENTVLLKSNNRNDDRFYVLGIGTWLAVHLHRTLFNLSDANAWTKASWNMFFYQVGMQDAQSNCLCISLYACLCTRLCMNSVLALLFVWLMLPSLVHTESIYDAAIWKIASTLTFDGFMSSYQELRN